MIVCNVQAQNGSTALHNAAANGHAKAVEALVAAPSCDCDVQNSNGNTALHLAASKGGWPAISNGSLLHVALGYDYHS